MKPETAIPEESFFTPDSVALDEATQRVKSILDAKYDAANINEIINKSNDLTLDQKDDLSKLLKNTSHCLMVHLVNGKASPITLN